jgi:hypothetical protein
MLEEEVRRCRIGMIAGVLISCRMEMTVACVYLKKQNENKSL